MRIERPHSEARPKRPSDAGRQTKSPGRKIHVRAPVILVDAYFQEMEPAQKRTHRTVALVRAAAGASCSSPCRVFPDDHLW